MLMHEKPCVIPIFFTNKSNGHSTIYNESFAVLFIFEKRMRLNILLLDFSLTVKAATLIFVSGYGSTISSAKEEKSGFIYN